MTLLQPYLEQINLSAESIGQSEFDTPKCFTHALLYNTEITTLIRDTEPYEHGLFSTQGTMDQLRGSRRSTVQDKRPPQPSAVATVLGSDMLKRIQQPNRTSGGIKSVDMEILLQGAEKLCSAYEVRGAYDRIASLRQRHQRILTSIQQYNQKVSAQQTRLRDFNDGRNQDHARMSDVFNLQTPLAVDISEEDMLLEEEAVRDLESKRRALEQRVAEMERDLGGLRS